MWWNKQTRMGQEHSVHGGTTSERSFSRSTTQTDCATPSDKRDTKRGSKLRKGANTLITKALTGSVSLSKRGNEPEIPTVKKAKIPEGSLPTMGDAQARERLLSCPDFHHHSESEMVRRLESLLTPKVDISPSPVHPSAVTSSIAAAMKLFDGANPPKISLNAYIQRMLYYLGGIAETERKCGVDANVHSDLAVRYLLTSLLYIERIQAKTAMVITLFNVHRLLITGVLIAAKVLDDYQPNQKYFADLGGVSTLELARLEGAFLLICDYNVNVDPLLFAEKYACALERERAFSDVNQALSLGAVFSPKITAKTIAV